MAGSIDSHRVSAVVILLVIAVIGGVLVWSKYDRTPPFEIALDRDAGIEGEIYVGDGVAIPGFYPFASRDTVDSLLQSAGGVIPGADLGSLRLDVPVAPRGAQPQRIDINRADSWLLRALPGIGETLAQRIIDFRRQNGPFRNTDDLMNVSGIGKDNYAKIKDLVTVDGE